MRHSTRVVFCLLLLSSCILSSCSGSGSDVQCLKDLKESLGDPNGELSTWNFSDDGLEGEGYICLFEGVECWNPNRRVLSLRLANLGLQGSFPRGLELCSSMTALDLSGNGLTGPLPADIHLQLPYLTDLDFGYNSFSGEIPGTLANLSYLNVLDLEHNRLTGRIPEQIGDLARLTSLNVADNSLSGPIPESLQKYGAASFAGNGGLCGAPMDRKCKKRFRVRPARIHLELRKINDASSIGAAVGFVVGFVVAFYFPHWFIFSRKLHPYIVRIC